MTASDILQTQQAEIIEHISSTKSGYLHKTGKSGQSTWKKRYFRLKGNFLYYFKSKNAASPRGSIPLQQATVLLPNDIETSVTARRFMFHVETPPRVFNLAADDEETLKDWMETIQDTIDEYVNGTVDDTRLSVKAADAYWLTIKQESYLFPTNIQQYTEKVYGDSEWLSKRNAEQFGPVDKNDPESELFFALTYQYVIVLTNKISLDV